jgi:hypothetical protein
MNLHKELTKMGIGATTLPSFQFVREAAWFTPTGGAFTAEKMTEVSNEICGSIVSKAVNTGGKDFGRGMNWVVGFKTDKGYQQLNLTTMVEKPAKQVAENSAEIQTLNASKTGTSKAVPILLAITIGMTVVWIAINEILKSFWD